MKRILSTILIIAMMLSVLPVIGMAEETADAPYADGVGEIPENLFSNPKNSSLWYTNPTYVNSTTVQTKNEWTSDGFAGYAFKTTGIVTNKTNGWQVAAGSRLIPAQFNDYTATEGEHYVIKFAARSLTENTGFGVRIGTWNGAYSGTSADVSQIMDYENGVANVPGDGRWHTIKGTLPALRANDINDSGKIRMVLVGMAAGTPADVTMELNNHYKEIPDDVPYFAKEAVAQINLEADKDVVEAGDTVTLTAEVLNQIGTQGAIDQEAINWYVTNEERTEKIELANAFEFDGCEMTVGTGAPAGNYYIVAESADNTDVRKGAAITVKEPVKEDYVPVDTEDGKAYDITLTRTSEEREYYTSLNELTLTASLVDKDGNTEGIDQNISWIILDSEKRNEVTEGFFTASEGGSITVNFDAALPEGTYYVRAYKDGDVMFGKNFPVVIDNTYILRDIIEEINDNDENLKENLPKYLPYIDAENELYDETDKDNFITVLASMAEEEEFTADNLKDRFMLACIISLYNVPSENVELFQGTAFVYEKELGLDKIANDSSNLYTKVYAEGITDAGREKIKNAVAEAKTQKDFVDAFCESTLLCAISDTVYLGTNYVTELLTEENLKKAKIDADGYLASDAKELYEEEIAHKTLTKAQLEKILAKEYTEEDEEESSSSSVRPGGGGGGGSSVSIAGPSVSVATPKEEEKEPAEEKDVHFNDLDESHWAFVNIQFLAKLDVLNGDSNGNFRPESKVTREEFVKIIVEAFDLTGDTGINFGDVESGSWYEKYVKTAVANGIINGKADGSFGVGEAVSREDMCVMIARVLKMGEDAEGSLSYSDAEEISPYAKNAVSYLSMLSMINGMPDNTFRPKEACTRSQAARVVADILNYNVMEVNGK